MSLSVIIPCFNEETTIAVIVDKVSKSLVKAKIKYEIIVVNDGSTDKSMINLSKSQCVYSLIHQENLGKGKAVQNGIRNARFKYILVQDADLEYNPNDIKFLYNLVRNNSSSVVYGSRMLKNTKMPLNFTYSRPPNYSVTSYGASIFFSIFHFILYRIWISDTLTGYKLYPIDFFRNNKIVTVGFETDHEITGKLIQSGYQILEVPIKYYPRSKLEGKKIGIKDFFVGLSTIFKTKFRLI